MPAFSSKSVRPPTAMRPRSGLTSPAIAFTSVLLPAPERPKSATMGASAAKRASRRNPPCISVTSTSSMGRLGAAAAAHEPFREGERRDRERDGEEREAQDLVVVTGGLRERVDRERQRLRLARDVRDEGDRGAELTERAREGEDRAGDEARPCEGQRHGKEHPKRARAERARRELDAPVDGVDRQTYCSHHQRESHDRRGERRARP